MFRLTKDGRVKYLSTGYSATPDQWDDHACVPRRNYPNCLRLKHLLTTRELEIQDVVIELDAIGDPYTVEDVKARLDRHQSKVTIQDHYREKAERLNATGHTGNARVYSECLKHFDRYAQRPITFQEFNYRKLKLFEEHMAMKGLSVNTIAMRMRTLRAVFNSAIKEGLVHEKFYPFKNYSIKMEQTRKRALTADHIRQIEEIELDHPSEAWARDLFLFSFYCMGMSFVDMSHLKWDDIRNDRIQYKRSKTGILYNIGFHPKLKVIVDRFKEQSTDEYVLPIIEEGKPEYMEYRNDLRWYNRLLHRIGEQLDLPIPLTSYVSRHSWATIAKRKGVSTSIISEGLGHTTERTTQIYLDSFENASMDEANLLVVS